MINCSACILTYNNEKTLEKCLESVKDFSDIVILDGGSTDNTLEIAKKYGARIFFQHENGRPAKIADFTGVREKLYSLAKEDWRLSLDSDEWLSIDAREAIKKISVQEDCNVLYTFPNIAVIGGKVIKYAYFYPINCRRLFNRKAAVFLRKGKKVHEELVYDEKSVKMVDTGLAMYHSWNSNHEEILKKDDHYLSLTVVGKENFSFSKKMWIAMINLLKATKVFLKSSLIYLRYGFGDTLPVFYSWRFVRYHLVYARKILMLNPDKAGK